MAKRDSKPTERVIKKAKIDTTSKVPKHRVKDSSRAHKSTAYSQSLPKSTDKGKAKAIDTSATSKPKPIKNHVREEEEYPLPSTFKVIAGSYEKLLYGLDGSVTTSEDDESKLEFHLKPIFIFPAHVSCIKAVAASPQGGKWLASGSADEIVKVWDLRRRKEIGGLMHHEGSITHLSFPSRSHLLSASEDGTLCLFRARDWAVLRTLKGHKGRVNSVAVHPSGKVALSVGKDRALRMWDLMRGKGCASTKLGKEGEIVRWSVDGSLFAVQSGSTIDVYSTDMDLLHTIKHPSRLHDLKFCKRISGDGEVLLAGAEDKKLTVYEISKDNPPKIIAEMVGHTNRVKALQTLDIALPPSSGRTSTTIICTVSSDGKIHIYDLAHVPSHADKLVEIAPVAEYDSKGTRLTCVTVGDGEVLGVDGQVNGKRKREDDEEAEGGAESDEEGGFGSGWEDEGEEVDGEEEVEDEEDAEVEEEEESEG